MKTKKIVMAALLAALACVATIVIKIPTPLKGYFNLGDCVVLISGWMLSPAYGFLAAAIGSALADVFLGYVSYAPATFIIKGIMALCAGACCRAMSKNGKSILSLAVSGLAAEIIMVGGYLLFESFLYGFVPSLVNVPANGFQGLMGLILGTVLMKIFEKGNIKF
ncbi:MAG: ECF transporter S component [Clostridia bacterium]|nr:ECF transporter S component [Clostridia bacterium]